jgi:Uma2 family endonuclease
MSLAHAFTVEEYERLGPVLGDVRTELIDGEVHDMPPIGPAHAGAVERIADLLRRTYGERAQVRVQQPVVLDEHNEPQPDISVVAPRVDFYAEAHPRPEDILLLVEVVVTNDDRARKTPGYGRTGVPETWVVDITRGHVSTFRWPAGHGYSGIHVIESGLRDSPLDLLVPGLEVSLYDLVDPMLGR